MVGLRKLGYENKKFLRTDRCHRTVFRRTLVKGIVYEDSSVPPTRFCGSKNFGKNDLIDSTVTGLMISWLQAWVQI